MHATFNSVGIELRFSGDADGDATAALAFKRATESDWRPGLPLWRTNDGSVTPGPAFYGSVLLLDAGTAYDVQVTLSDPDGMRGPVVLTGSLTTRAETILPASVLLPTHYVRADGSDTNSGTSPTSAWRTLEKALVSAPAGAVVQVGPGRYERARSARALPLTVVAQYPAVDDQRTVINAGLHSTIDFGLHTAPGQGAWQPVQLVGPGYGGAPAGATYTIWRWARVGLRPESLAFASALDDTPQRVALWDRKGADMATVPGMVEKLFTNRTYNYGWFVERNADYTYDLYLRLPGDRDPNTLFMSTGGFAATSRSTSAALAITGPDIRVSGFRIQHGEVWIGPTATRAVIDHTLLEMAVVQLTGTKPGTYGRDHVIERNRIVDTNLWTDDHVHAPAIPWAFIKATIINADGTDDGNSRIGAAAERTAVKNSGGALATVIRRNTIEGIFNGVGGNNAGYDRYSSSNNDVYENELRRIDDDALEPENNAINWRAWHNRVDDAVVVLSLGPVKYGPLYVVRNEGWRIGPTGAGRVNDGSIGPSGKVVKYSNASVPAARVYLLHNTFWTDEAGKTTGVSGGENSAGGSGGHEAFFLQNNLFRTSKYGFAAPGAGRWEENGNHFASTDTGRGLEYAGRRYTTDLEAYRTVSGQGAHTNRAGDFVTVGVVDTALVDPRAGDLSLRTGAPFVDAGVIVPNVSDSYSGTAPDLGARERN